MTTCVYDNIHSTKHAGKIALVTGGGSSIGLVTAKRLAREGASAGGGEFTPLGEITEAQFVKYFGINAKGTLFTVQAALPLMSLAD